MRRAVAFAALVAGCDVGPLTEIYDAGTLIVIEDRDAGPPRDAGAVAGTDGGPLRDGGFEPMGFPFTSNFDPDTLPPAAGDFDVHLGDTCRLITSRAGPRFEGNGCDADEPPFLYTTPAGDLVVMVHVDVLDLSGTLDIDGELGALFVAQGEARLDGVIRVSARGATPGPGAASNDRCGASRDAIDSHSGGGGGGFGGPGGGGGRPTAAQRPGAPGAANGNDTLIPLRGGCSGGTGAPGALATGGAGGGALQISTRGQVSLDGEIFANGGGGTSNSNGGGGGGGSGGAVLLEGRSVDIGDDARILASGAGGGGAGATNADGFDGTETGLPAPGGAGTAPGGVGAIGAFPPGDGTNSTGFGGGGGGGVGRLRINATTCAVHPDARLWPTPAGSCR